MITVTLTREENAARATALAEYANRLAELADEEEGAKARHKQLMADIKERGLQISGELRRLSRAVRLGVEERTTQRVLFDEEKRLEEFRREQEVKDTAERWIEQAEELIEQQQAEIEKEERERLHGEAVATWRRERPATEESEPEARKCGCGDYGYEHAPNGDCTITACECKEFREDFSAAYPDNEIEAVIDSDGAVADDFTAPRCDECGRIDGAHAKECSKSNELRFDDYLAYARAHYKSNHQSHARKLEVSGLMDDKVREWKERSPETAEWITGELKQQQAGNRSGYAITKVEFDGKEPESPKKKKRAKKGEKLSPVEAAIDR